MADEQPELMEQAPLDAFARKPSIDLGDSFGVIRSDCS